MQEQKTNIAKVLQQNTTTQIKMIPNTSPKEFFNSLNLAALPDAAKQYILTDIVTDETLPRLSADDEDYKAVVDILMSNYKSAIPVSEAVVEEPASGKSADAIKYEQEISELNELIEMESDKKVIAKYKKEIAELQELIEMETYALGGYIAKAKEIAKKGVSKGKEYAAKGKKYAKDKVHEKKKDVALNVSSNKHSLYSFFPV